MIDSGAAKSVMGNHEFNAIAYYTECNGEFLRPNNKKNYNQHKSFLEKYEGEDDYPEIIDWFKTLPLWLELPGLRIVHACWDRAAIKRISNYQNGDARLNCEFIIEASNKNSQLFDDVELILKGKEVKLPDGCSFKDKDGHVREDTRIRWWDKEAKTYKDAFMGPESARQYIPDEQIEGDHSIEYTSQEPPVFLGHYWFDTEPEPLTDNIACIDYSVAKEGGNLVAYRFDGERILQKDKFVTISRLEK